MARNDSIKTVVDRSAAVVSYIGTKAALIAAGVAPAEMFPAPEKKRRYSSRYDLRQTPFYFATTAIGAEFRVTRWLFWNDEIGAKRERERMAERERRIEEIRRKHAEQRAASREAEARAAIARLREIYPRDRIASVANNCLVLVSELIGGKTEDAEGWRLKEYDAAQDHMWELMNLIANGDYIRTDGRRTVGHLTVIDCTPDSRYV